MVVWFRAQNTDNGQHHLGWLLTVLLDTHTHIHTLALSFLLLVYNLIGQKMCVSTDCFLLLMLRTTLLLWLTALGSVRMLSNREHSLTVFVFYDLFTILSHRQLPLCQEYCSTDMTHCLHFICRWSTSIACLSPVHLVTPHKRTLNCTSVASTFKYSNFSMILPSWLILSRYTFNSFCQLQQEHHQQQQPPVLSFSIIVKF